MNKYKLLLSPSMVLFFSIFIIVFYPIVTSFIPLSEAQRLEIIEFKRTLNLCKSLSQAHKVKEFSYMTTVTYIDEIERYSFLERWSSLEGLPLHLRYAGTFSMMGKLHSYWLLFGVFGILHVVPDSIDCMPHDDGRSSWLWSKDEKIFFYPLEKKFLKKKSD